MSKYNLRSRQVADFSKIFQMSCEPFSSYISLSNLAEKRNCAYEFVSLETILLKTFFLNYHCFQKRLKYRPVNQAIRRFLKGMKAQKAEAIRLADNLCMTCNKSVIIIHNCDKWQIRNMCCWLHHAGILISLLLVSYGKCRLWCQHNPLEIIKRV